VIPVFPTSGGATDSAPLLDKQKLFPDRIRYELAAVSFINEPIKVGANLLGKCDVSASCTHD
jgi:hypothetical protein